MIWIIRSEMVLFCLLFLDRILAMNPLRSTYILNMNASSYITIGAWAHGTNFLYNCFLCVRFWRRAWEYDPFEMLLSQSKGKFKASKCFAIDTKEYSTLRRKQWAIKHIPSLYQSQILCWLHSEVIFVTCRSIPVKVEFGIRLLTGECQNGNKRMNGAFGLGWGARAPNFQPEQ